MYLAKVNYKKENVAQVLSLILKDIINENTIVICIGTDRAIGDALGPLVGTMLKNSDFKYPVYGTLDNPIHALNIYESIEEIKRLHPKGDALGPLVGTMLKNSDFKYPVYGTLDNPIHALNIYESIEEIKRLHPKGEFLAIDACLGSKNSIGNIQIRKGPILPGKGVGKKLPQVGSFSIVGIVKFFNSRYSR